jgi:phospholipid/cholesterol/gamma-HCH transport system permease protein
MAAPDLTGVKTLVLEDRGIETWDSSLVVYCQRLLRQAHEHSITIETQLPHGVTRLLKLADAVPRQERRRSNRTDLPLFLDPLQQARTLGKLLRGQFEFIGDLLRSTGNVLGGRSNIRAVDVLRFCRQAGSSALPIISLTSILVGMILGYLGAVQLQQFGAGIYVANLVTVGVLREMGPLMTAIIMAGRTGAAYAAQLGTMQVNEEVDAIEILGISPTEFLVLPRIFGLLLMMPILVVYSDLIGIVGGGLVASGLGISPLQYITQVEGSLTLTHLFIGLIKALVFALLIGIAGTRAGMVADRNSEGVGRATTEAVVTALVYLIVADAAANIICQLADI